MVEIVVVLIVVEVAFIATVIIIVCNILAVSTNSSIYNINNHIFDTHIGPFLGINCQIRSTILDKACLRKSLETSI